MTQKPTSLTSSGRIRLATIMSILALTREMECQSQVSQRQNADLQQLQGQFSTAKDLFSLSICCRLGVSACWLFLIAATPEKVGTFIVVGDSGAEPIHLIAFPNDLLLFLQRGANANGTSYTPEMEVRFNWRLTLAAVHLGETCATINICSYCICVMCQ